MTLPKQLFTIPKKFRNFRVGCRVYYKLHGYGIITDVGYSYSTKQFGASWENPELRVCRIRFENGFEGSFSIGGLIGNDNFQILSLG